MNGSILLELQEIEKNKLFFKIKDSGKGINEAQRKKLFIPKEHCRKRETSTRMATATELTVGFTAMESHWSNTFIRTEILMVQQNLISTMAN